MSSVVYVFSECESELLKIFRKIDNDGDDRIDLKEFTACIDAVKDGSFTRKEIKPLSKLAQSLEANETFKSGDQVTMSTDVVTQDADEQFIMTVFKNLDRDKTGMISLVELKASLRSHDNPEIIWLKKVLGLPNHKLKLHGNFYFTCRYFVVKYKLQWS